MKYIGYVPVATFVAFTIKSLVIQPSLFEILAIVATGALTGFFYYKEQNKDLQEFNTRLNRLEEEFRKNEENLSSLKTNVSALRMGNSIRTGNVQNR
jgi:hypothetical protein